MPDTNPTPGWLRDMSNERLPHIVAEGPEEGAIRYLDEAEAKRALTSGSHIDVTGRDMTTFDLAAERDRMTSERKRRRVPPVAPEKQGEKLPEDAPAPRANARVGEYENRAMATKVGKRG